jgi:hypothetical protein
MMGRRRQYNLALLLATLFGGTAAAQSFVSGNTDLLALGSHEGIEIVNARQALDRVAEINR